MDSYEYRKGVLRTESGRFDAANVSHKTLFSVFRLFAAAGRAMDCIKRALYYGKPLDQSKLNSATLNALTALTTLNVMREEDCQMKGYSESPAVDPKVIHAAVGLSTEAGEIIERILQSLEFDEDFDFGNLFEELGDIAWYEALAIDTAAAADPASLVEAHPQLPDPKANGFREWSHEAIWNKNLSKLKARYPDKFDTERAFDRDVDAEMKALI